MPRTCPEDGTALHKTSPYCFVCENGHLIYVGISRFNNVNNTVRFARSGKAKFVNRYKTIFIEKVYVNPKFTEYKNVEDKIMRYCCKTTNSTNKASIRPIKVNFKQQAKRKLRNK